MLSATGVGAPPEWYGIEAAAEAWGIPPWVVEDTAPALWVDRFVAMANAKAAAQKQPKPKAGMKKLV